MKIVFKIICNGFRNVDFAKIDIYIKNTLVMVEIVSFFIHIYCCDV